MWIGLIVVGILAMIASLALWASHADEVLPLEAERYRQARIVRMSWHP